VSVRRILARVAVVGGLTLGGLAVTTGVAHAQPREECIRHNQSLGDYHMGWANFWYGMGNQFYSQGDYSQAADAYGRSNTEAQVADAYYTAGSNC